MTKSEYVRVGTTYYKMVNQPQLRGGSVRKRIPWSVETLRQDHGKNFIADIPKYDGFCTVPSHTDYREEIDNFLNLYEPIDHVPAEGPFPHIESLVRHIFGEQYELGMDYLQLLYLRPVGTLLRKKDIVPRYVCEHCAASQQFNAFNNHRQTYTARRLTVHNAMTTYNSFGGVFMVRVGKRCLHTYSTYYDLLNCPPSINR